MQLQEYFILFKNIVNIKLIKTFIKDNKIYRFLLVKYININILVHIIIFENISL